VTSVNAETQLRDLRDELQAVYETRLVRPAHLPVQPADEVAQGGGGLVTTATDTIDWAAVEQVATRLGINTRRLVLLGDPDAAIAWALQMSREWRGLAALSYYELAVMLGYREQEAATGATLEWRELIRSVETIAATVKMKIDAEQAAAKEAARIAAESPREVVEERVPEGVVHA
jgi:hypothetical protein